ncbi:MAG: SH3 domain-containing protein [Clostridiales bacterium]|nr:SH3 domain-containing protein [Clostridiales bacterium]
MSDFEKKPVDENIENDEIEPEKIMETGESVDGKPDVSDVDVREPDAADAADADPSDIDDTDSDAADTDVADVNAADTDNADDTNVTDKEQKIPDEADGSAESNPDENGDDVTDREAVISDEAENSAEEEAGTPDEKETKPEGDILDDLEFISQESVKDKSKTATGEVIEDEIISRKKTRRRSVDAGAARKEKVQKIARKNLIPILIGIVVAIVVIAAAVIGIRKTMEKKAAENKEQPVSSQEYETDAYEQINEVVTNYYACYADGDVSTILQYAYPMSETEQTYIQMYSEFVESYENIVCYTKTGADDSSYIVSVSFDVKYNEIETTAAGMDFFYVRTAEDGTAYIDNTYSPFNLLYQEYTLDQETLQLIQTYEQSEDVIALQAGVQTKYEQALEQDEALRTLVEGDLATAISTWQSEYESVLAEKAAAAAEQVGESQSDEAADTSSDETSDSSDETSDSSDEDDSDGAADESDADEKSSDDTEDASSESSETEEKAWVYVTDTVYIRENPSESADVLASATAGSQIRQLAVTSDGWTKVKSGDIVGYIKSEYISTSSSSSSSSSTGFSAGTTITLTSSVNIRSSMSESSDRIGLAYSGEKVTVVMSYSEGWTKVTWNGKTGYIRTDILAGM